MTTAVPLDPQQAGPSRVGVLLVNLGTPDTADAKGVRVYLREFLSDPRVIENNGLIWQIILNGIVLQIRPAKKAKDYLKIWNTDRNESPLKTITRAQAAEPVPEPTPRRRSTIREPAPVAPREAATPFPAPQPGPSPVSEPVVSSTSGEPASPKRGWWGRKLLGDK